MGMDANQLTLGQLSRLASALSPDAERTPATEAGPDPEAPAADHGLCIAVVDQGWVYVGRVSSSAGLYTISGARNVRRWGTTEGLLQLAEEGPRPNTVLDGRGEVLVPEHAVIQLIRCKEGSWRSHG